MTYSGHIENGVVVFDEAVSLPEGTRVEVTPQASGPDPGASPKRLIDLAGIIESGLPTDLAENLDHYLHGQPKR